MINLKGFASLEKLPEKLHIYTGIFLDEYARDYLLRHFPPKFHNVYADHVTLWYKPDLDQVQKIYAANSPATQRVCIEIIGYAADERCQAVLVRLPFADFMHRSESGIVVKNELLHITISCADATSPVYSNELLKNGYEKYVYGITIVGLLGVCSHSDRAYLPQGMWKRRGL